MSIEIDSIESKDDFVQYLSELRKIIEQRDEAFENDTTIRYLETIEAWTDDMHGYFRNAGLPEEPVPSWKLFARILTSALDYE